MKMKQKNPQQTFLATFSDPRIFRKNQRTPSRIFSMMKMKQKNPQPTCLATFSDSKNL
jgi:hypothetical protein